MSELDKLEEYLATKTINTAKSYRLQYRKLLELLDKDVNTSGEKNIILASKTNKNVNSAQAMINVAVLIKRLYDKPHAMLITQRDKNKVFIDMNIKQTNIEIQGKLPAYKKLVEYTDNLYDKNKYIDYVINYLLINYFVRNKDLLFEIVQKKKDMTDQSKNYMWLPRHGKKCEFVRQSYKTADVYGKKSIIITDPKFILAIKRIYGCQKYNIHSCGDIIPTETQVGYYIKRATMDELGEGSYFKIAVNEFKNDLQKLKEMSYYRGTSVDTIINSYDVDNT